MSKCPRCGSTNTNAYRHPRAKVWCIDCNFVLKEEGSDIWNTYKESAPSEVEVYKWLREQKFQTDQGEQEYTMYFDVDMPEILEKYYQWRKEK